MLVAPGGQRLGMLNALPSKAPPSTHTPHPSKECFVSSAEVNKGSASQTVKCLATTWVCC